MKVGEQPKKRNCMYFFHVILIYTDYFSRSFVIGLVIIFFCFSLSKCHELIKNSKSEFSLTITTNGNPTGMLFNKLFKV